MIMDILKIKLRIRKCNFMKVEVCVTSECTGCFKVVGISA